MARCFLCRKSQQIGRSSKHKRGVAGKQWLKRAQKTVKIFNPNLHVTRLEKNGKKAKVKVCTKCLRRVKKKNEVIHGWKAVAVAIQKVEEKPVVVKEEKPFIVEREVKKEIKEEKKEVKKPSRGRSAPGGKPVRKKSTKKKETRPEPVEGKPAPKKPPAPKSARRKST